MTQQIVAPLAGNVTQILIKTGEAVEEDAEILIIEAMKMETPVYAPCSGTITEIKTKEGSEVEEDDILALIDES